MLTPEYRIQNFEPYILSSGSCLLASGFYNDERTLMRIEDLQGRQIGRYEVTGLLGRGGMAAVYRARDTALQREIALKILYPQYLHDEDQIARFKREAVVAASLDHPNIVQIYDVGDDQGLVYIAMQLLPGRALGDLLRERGRLEPHELAPMVDQIASALDYAHSRGIIHRDIKPANILIDAEGRAMLTDFGIAKMLDAPGFTSTSVMIGTPDYMAPEQIGSQPIDGRVDIYALGVLIFRALTGRRPFEGGTDEVLLGHLNGTPPAASSIVPGLPTDVDAIIRTAMARRPDDRFQRASDLAAELHEAAGLPANVSQRRRAAPLPVPVIAPTVLTTDAPTMRGSVYPVAASSIDATARVGQRDAATIGRTAQADTRRRTNALLPVIVALLLVIAGGGGFLLARQLFASAGDSNGGIVIVPTNAALTPTTDTPPATNAVPPTQAPIVIVVTATGAPIIPATAAPPATNAPTNAPASPTTAPTKTPVPTTTPASATATLTPTATPTITPTVEVTPTPEITELPTLPAVELKGGFGALYNANAKIRQQLGAPIQPERNEDGAEQPFEHGSMFWTGDTYDRYYVLLETGAWQLYDKANQKGIDAPPTEAPNGLFLPVSGFGIVWGTHSELLTLLGYATRPEERINAVYQQFETGVMLYSDQGLGKGATIYVLDETKTFSAYKDPNAQ